VTAVETSAATSGARETAREFRERIPVRVGGALKLIPVDAIDRIEASGDYAELHCRDRRYLATERMTALAESLDPASFIRIHRSTIVRVDRIRELRPRTHGDYDVALADGHVARLSRTYRGAVAAALGVHL
jgi:two-component system, LytTR family, response regulator